MNQVSIFSRAGVRPVTADAMADLGPGMHPRISIKGGRFTLIDAGGIKYPWPRLDLPVIVVGANPNKSKVYYEGKFDPDTTMPPTCYSDNGTAPSAQAQQKMARTCAECELGGWGSDTSEISGKPTKACNDRKKVAVIVVGDTANLVYEMQIPPASLKLWTKYCGFVGSNTTPDGNRKADLSDLVTSITFDDNHPFVLNFKECAWLDQVDGHGQIHANGAPDGGAWIASWIDDIWDSEMWQDLVGFKDQPWSGALPAPSPVQALPAGQPQATPARLQGSVAPAPAGYAGPPGVQATPTQRVFPAAVAPECKPEPVQVPSRRGGARAGAGRKPAAVQEVLPPETAQQAAETPREVPAFLQHGRPAETAAAPVGDSSNGAKPATVAPFARPDPPPSGIAGAISAAFSLATKRS